MRNLLAYLHAFVVFGLGLTTTNTLRAQVISASLSRSFTNPTPEAQRERFGSAVATLGNDRIFIAAEEDTTGGALAGAVYLYNTNGTALMTFTNPSPSETTFGYSLGLVGADKVLIGSPFGTPSAAGKAYLFTTNAVLLTVFTNPEPVHLGIFGSAVAAINDEIVAIGANGNGENRNGAVYLYSLNGTLITTIQNANPDALFDGFGYSLAAFETDRLLVGAPASTIAGTRGTGAAYLFSTNGSLLYWFTNPAPAAISGFGSTVAQMDTHRVLISARKTNTTGIVYLFNTNGTQLATFFSPRQIADDAFGASIAVIGTNWIVISAPQDRPGDALTSEAGAAYIFKTNGTLLGRIRNPTPRSEDRFGSALAAIGSDKILVGAEQKSANASDPSAVKTGAAYIFTLNVLPPPLLSAERLTNSTVRVWWPQSVDGFVLEQCSSLNSPPDTNTWTLIAPPYQSGVYSSNGIFYPSWYVNFTPSSSYFYRLRQP